MYDNPEAAQAQKKAPKPGSLGRSFLIVSILLLLVQVMIFSIYALSFGFFDSYAPVFFVSSSAFHAMLYGLLILFKHDFCKEPGGEILSRINLANIITLFRLSALPTALAVLLASKDYPMRASLIFLLILVFASDFLDGYVSRKGKQVTRAGKILDASSDYALLFVVGLVFLYFHFIPAWFFAVLLLRLGGQAAMMALLLALKRKINPASTLFGKIAIASTMILFIAELTRLFLNLPQTIYRILEIVTAIILFVSLAEKISVTIGTYKTPKSTVKANGRLHGALNEDGGAGTHGFPVPWKKFNGGSYGSNKKRS